ncbi:MAG: GspH/FimT family pseudopilin [Deltaproteobacteria bacterium]|nr:GspH/FimT family pseudopilin [Deltaproteobacteria bacterium]
MVIARLSKGYTIIELLTVVALLAILTTISVPTFQAYAARQRVNGAARQVLTDLMAARMKAVSMNRRVGIFLINGHQYKICDDANNDGTVANGEGTVIAKDIHPDYYDVALSANFNPLFYTNGTARNGTVIITGCSISKNITVSIAGRATIN